MRRREIGINPVTREPIFASAPVPPPMLDFGELCRDSDKIDTFIEIYTDYARSGWMRLGQIQLRERTNSHDGVWTLGAYLRDGATDFEHDSAWLLKMELVGVKMVSVEYGHTELVGWVRADNAEGFNVPNVGYNPLALANVAKCKQCKGEDAHVMVPEGFYVPPPNYALYEMVRGRKVEVRTGLKWK